MRHQKGIEREVVTKKRIVRTGNNIQPNDCKVTKIKAQPE